MSVKKLSFSFVLFCALAILFVLSYGYQAKVRLQPQLIIGGTMVLVALEVLVDYRRYKKNLKAAATGAEGEKKHKPINLRKWSYFWGSIILLFIINYLFGFLVATAIFLGPLIWVLGYQNKQNIALTVVGTVILIYLIFVQFLGMALSSGLIFGG